MNTTVRPPGSGQVLDVLYYSNYCKHSQQVLQHVTKHNLMDILSCICIDKRARDINNNHMYVTLENGRKILMPPGVHSVPALLLVSKNHIVILGSSNIVEQLQTRTTSSSSNSVSKTVETEPVSFQLGDLTSKSNIFSEKFTDYHLAPEILSSKGMGAERTLHNYVPADNNLTIHTPEERYKPDKLSTDVTIDTLQQQRLLQ